jgi:broad specificity phosphatase PhoE
VTDSVRLYLVRHGRASAGWDTDVDPGLDELGRQQAVATAHVRAPLGPLEVITSPLRRCQETAAALAGGWGVVPVVDPAVAEIPSPVGVEMTQRVQWLREAMKGTWGDLGHRYTTFRDGVVTRLAACAHDTVVFSHFVAINAAIGAALGDDRLVIHSLDNASVTVLEVTNGRFTLVDVGREADTLIR